MSGTLKRKSDIATGSEISKNTASKLARKATRKITQTAEDRLLDFCKSFERGYELEHTREIDNDEPGVIMFNEGGVRFACPISSVQYLLENEELHDTNEESDVKCFSEDEYGPIAHFAEQLERLAAKLIEGAKLARAAGIQNVKEGAHSDDEEDESESNGDNKD
jgi:hypothetical protein